MHELSIAMSLVQLAREELRQQGGASVKAVYLRLGPLSGVVGDALLSAYKIACENSPLEGSQLHIEEVPVQILCPSCRVERNVKSIQDMRCGMCGTPGNEVTHGRELEIYAMEICDEPA